MEWNGEPRNGSLTCDKCDIMKHWDDCFSLGDRKMNLLCREKTEFFPKCAN